MPDADSTVFEYASEEAALKQADEWDAEAAGSLLEEINEVQRECATALRAAITAALTGAQLSEDGDHA